MNNLKSYRKAAGLTQKELAQLAGCTAGAISHWESGRQQMKMSTCRKLVNILRDHGFYTSMDQLACSSTQMGYRDTRHFTSP